MGSDSLIEDRALAERLRALRLKNEWSLAEAEEHSGVSRSTLSRIENGDVSPTTQVLGKLCRAYGLSVSKLLFEVEEAFERHIRRANQTVWEDRTSGLVRRSVSPPSMQLSAEVVKCTLKSGANIEYDAPPVDRLEHHLLMLKGTLQVTLGGNKYVLKSGDCLRYRLEGPNRFECKGSSAVEYYLVLV